MNHFQPELGVFFFGEGVFCRCEVPEMRDRESKMSISSPYIYQH